MPSVEIPNFAGGLDLRLPYQIPDNACQVLGNARVQEGTVYRDASLTAQNATAITGLQWLDIFRRSGGAPVLITFSISTVYQGTAFTVMQSGLTGAQTDKFQAASFNDRYYFTNGVEQVKVWTGTGLASDIGGSPQFSKAVTLAAFQDRLFVANTTESAVAQPSRLRWSKVNDGDNWTDATSGFLDLVRASEPILTMVPLEDSLIVFTRTQIWRVFREDPPLMFDAQMVTDAASLLRTQSGGSAVHSVARVGRDLYFLGQDNFYRFDGSSLGKVGDPVWRAIKDDSNLVPHQFVGGVDWLNRRIFWNWHATETFAYQFEEGHWEEPFASDSFKAARTPYNPTESFTSATYGIIGSFVYAVGSTPGSRPASYQVTLRSKAFGGGGYTKVRVGRVHFAVVTRNNLNPLTVKVTCYDDLDIKNFRTLDQGWSGLGLSRSQTRTLNINTNDRLYLDFDLEGRWFDIQVQDTTGTQASPERLLAGLVVDFESLGRD